MLFNLRFHTLLLSTAMPGVAAAQSSGAGQPVSATAAPADRGQEEIFVTGARLQAKKDIAAKRESPVISDSISSDEIGTLPDFGLGEALVRVPGITTIQNNARGEAQFLSIRGLNADYNLVEIDGVPLPANEVSRRNVSLDVIPSSLASRVDVYKSMTAAMNANAIGGIANLRTRSAFDNGGKAFLGGRVDLGKWDFQRTRGSRTPSGQAELVAATSFGPDRKFGVVVAGSYFRRDSASLDSATDNYLYVDPTTGKRLLSPNDDVSGAYAVPDRRRWLHYDNLRQRYGGLAKLEFDDHDKFKAALTVAEFHHINDEDRQSNIVIANAAVTAATNKYTYISGVGTAGGSVASANGQVDQVSYYQKRGIRYADFHGELTPGNHVRADLGVNYAIATYRQDATLSTYRIANTTSLAYTYSLTPGQFTQFSFANPGYVFNAANYSQYEYGTTLDDQREKALTARANIGVNMGPGETGLGVAAGLYGRFVDRTYNYGVANYRPLSTSNYTLPGVLAPESYTPYNGNGQAMLLVDPGAATAFFNAHRSGFAATSTNATNSLSSDYLLSEDVTAAYLMARYATGPVRLTGGMRYEDTSLSTNSFTYTPKTSSFAYGQQGQRYHDWLPSAQLDWDMTPNLRLRAAYSRTLARANYSDLAARASITTDATGTVTITGGNPALKPRRSDNFDLSLEYYLSRDILFSAAGFIKNVSDEIVTVRNQSTELFNGVSTLVTRVQPINASSAKIRGVELNAVITRLAFLPRPLDGLGFAANLTLLDPTPATIAMSDGVTRRQLSGLFESANTMANARLFYTVGPVTLQGAWNHLSPILFSVSTADPLQDRRYATSDMFDAQIRLRLLNNLTLVAQGKNLTDQRPQRMFGPGFGLLREELENGRAWYLGAVFRY